MSSVIHSSHSYVRCKDAADRTVVKICQNFFPPHKRMHFDTPISGAVASSQQTAEANPGPWHSCWLLRTLVSAQRCRSLAVKGTSGGWMKGCVSTTSACDLVLCCTMEKLNHRLSDCVTSQCMTLFSNTMCSFKDSYDCLVCVNVVV